MKNSLSQTILITALFLFFSAPFAHAEDLKQCMQIAENILSKKYQNSQLNVLQPRGLPDSFMKRKFPIRNPAVVCTDLNGDNLIDIGMLLGDETLKILLQESDSEFKEVFSFDSDYGATLLLPKTKENIIKRIHMLGPDEAVKKIGFIEHPGVELVFYGKSSLTFFWNVESKQIEKVWTAD